MKCYISYTVVDTELALNLANLLKGAGFDVWFDQTDLIAGAHLGDATEKALTLSECIIVILTPSSVASRHVRDEVEFALEENKTIIPIMVQKCRVPLQLRHLQYIDLTTNYATGLSRLVHVLSVGPLSTATETVPEEGKPAGDRAPAKVVVDGVPTPLAVKPSRSHSGGGTESKEVHLGVATPTVLSPGEEFVVRFAAYTKECRSEVRRAIEGEAPSAQPRLDLETCRWRPGATVTVKLNANHVAVANAVQTFKWNGTWRLLRFDARVLDNIEQDIIMLRFDVAVERLPIVALRPEISVLKEKNSASRKSAGISVTEQAAPKSAFASYAKKDRRDVLARVRSLQIFTGIDVFLDCLSLRPGDEWKPKLREEIDRRDIFWLFWSRSAMASPWVEWEWRTALADKTLARIQPHPLESMEEAPPPQELADLQFGVLYEWYISQLRESSLKNLFRVLSYKAARLASWRRSA